MGSIPILSTTARAFRNAGPAAKVSFLIMLLLVFAGVFLILVLGMAFFAAFFYPFFLPLLAIAILVYFSPAILSFIQDRLEGNK